MCTVSFIPSRNQYFFTSSRDEHAGRPLAVLPRQYSINGQKVLYPKDPQAGGSWIAVHESGNTAVLLNGAIQAHKPEPPYRKSRGLILLDMISNPEPVQAFRDYDFHRIEPFTIILFENKKLWSGKWDGMNKLLLSLNPHRPHIWSSVTLYDKPAIQKRENWFNKWLAEVPNPETADIVRFHQQGGDGDPTNDLLMNRAGKLFTNSISSIRLSGSAADFYYLDLRNGETAEVFMPFQKTISVNA
jgi:hypothetical protein